MGKALYRKYRSKKLSEVVGQEHITTTLEKSLKSGKISHAYLFTGPRGVGKTSIARIVAHEINNIPYEDDTHHIDIIEIDAASNRRIDEIRDLREKVYTAPASAKYKVYIIDEVHMLTKEAFNALLKTLEEPPAHVVFILATTDLHKLPETIVSRTQRFSFKPVSKDKVAAHLGEIAKAEGIKADKDALELLAEHGEGSFRDSISMLDQTSGHTKHLTLEEVRNMLGIPPEESIRGLLGIVADGSSAKLMTELAQLYNSGYPAQLVAKELGKTLRKSLEEGKGQLSQEDTLELLGDLVEVPASQQPDRLLEIILLRRVKNSGMAIEKPKVSAEPAPISEKIKEEARAEKPNSAEALVEPEPEIVAAIVENPVEETAEIIVSPAKALDSSQVWPELLSELKKHHNTLYGVIRMAEPVFVDENNLQLNFSFAFHQKRISENTNKQVISRILHQLTGKPIEIECLHVKDSKKTQEAVKKTPPAKKDESIDTISNIFGGGELLES